MALDHQKDIFPVSQRFSERYGAPNAVSWECLLGVWAPDWVSRGGLLGVWAPDWVPRGGLRKVGHQMRCLEVVLRKVGTGVLIKD